MLVGPTQIAVAERDAMAIEEIQDLDRNLTAILDAVAELCSGELTVAGAVGEHRNNTDHLAHRRA
jgi:hypothetical protein